MAQLARLEFTVQDGSGNAVTGASVEVRSQGAQVFGNQAGPITTITVDSPGSVVATNTVAINLNATTRAVNSVTATTVDVSGPGFSTVSDDDRITIVTPLPTIYEDAEAATSKANPLTTDSNGYASCFIVGGKYDVVISGGGVTTRMLQDVAAAGGESMRSTIFSGTAWKLDSLRTLAATDVALDVLSAGVSKFKVMGDGEIVSGAAGATNVITGSLTVSNGITVTAGGFTVSAGGAAITGNSSVTGTLTTSSTLTVTAGGEVITAGDLTATASLANFKRVGATGGTAVVAGDFVLGAGWGATGAITNITAFSNDTRGQLRVTANGAGLAANPTITFTFKDGTYTSLPFVIAIPGTSFTVFAANDYWHANATATAATFILGGTVAPTAGRVYELNWLVIK